jgi:uncharacterized protein (DUF2267 family)
MATDYEQFIETVQATAEISRADAERAACDTLTTLAERLTGGEARDVAEQLPEPLATCLHDGDRAEAFHVDEFLRRIAERERVDVPTAERRARAVFAALGRAVEYDEIADLAAELPKDFEPLVAEAERMAARPARVLSSGEFVQRVALRADLDEAGARRAAEAALQALGERISAGEVEDIVDQVPEEFQRALMRGTAPGKERAKPIPFVEFVKRVAELEGVAPVDARKHARAALSTLRETISEKELRDILSQLPIDYYPLFWAE